MVFYKYIWKILIRLVIIFSLVFAGIYFVLATEFWTLSIWIFIAAVFATAEMIRFFLMSQRLLNEVLLNFDKEPYLFEVNKRNLRRFDENFLFRLGNFNKKLIDIKRNNESSFVFLETIINFIDIAVVCYNKDGKIKLYNKTAEGFFPNTPLQNIKNLTLFNTDILNEINTLGSNQKKIVALSSGGKQLKISLRKLNFKINDEWITLILIQNIKDELALHEVESWYRLARVLTHEIMNSAIPISNLTEFLEEKLISEDKSLVEVDKLETDEQEDIMQSIETIKNRSKGLARFVKLTKSITQLPAPILKTVELSEFFNKIQAFFIKEIKENKVEFQANYPYFKALVSVDLEQIEQVLINIVLNSMDAVKKVAEPKIEIFANETEGNVSISIKDNGEGIPEDELENIFIPFYTTKPEGSGIGLSIARQIMFNHSGNIEIDSSPQKGTIVILIFAKADI